MKNIYTLIMVFFLGTAQGYTQYTYVPDDNFEQVLIDLGYDDVLDDYVLTSNISSITSLDVSNKNISDLMGIESFISLQNLDCSYNSLTSININQNYQLELLYCQGNQLNNINVSQNINLTGLNCQMNNLTELNINANTLLKGLVCTHNNITQLDLSQNPLLDILYCYNSNLTKLDISQNPNLLQVWALPNYELEELNLKNGNYAVLNFSIPNPPQLLAPDLFCIEVDDVDWYYENKSSWFNYIGAGAVFSEDCAYDTAEIENIEAKNIHLYPIPVKDILYFEKEVKKITITDLTGKELSTQSNSTQIDMSNFQKGVYLITIEQEKNIKETKKIIKQ